MKSSYWRFPVLLILAVLMAVPQPLFAGPPQPMDLETDTNRDNVPDALALAVEEVATAKDQLAAIEALVERVPFSRETLALQERAYELQNRLSEVETQQQAEEIYAELEKISSQMMEDPTYARTIAALDTLYVQMDIIPEAEAKQKSDQQLLGVSWGSLSRGHILLVRNGKFPWTSFLYAMTYSHAGNYHGNSLVYESNADGVRLKPLSNWQSSGQYIALGYDKRRSSSEVQNALTWAEGYYGTNGSTPYNYWYPDKNTNSRLYCSQLTWKIHKHMGVDLDSNAWQYILWLTLHWGPVGTAVGIPAVSPDEIGLDKDIKFYSKGWN